MSVGLHLSLLKYHNLKMTTLCAVFTLNFGATNLQHSHFLDIGADFGGEGWGWGEGGDAAVRQSSDANWKFEARCFRPTYNCQSQWKPLHRSPRVTCSND